MTKEGLKALQLDMSEEQVVGLLGNALAEERRPDQVALEYAPKASRILIRALVRTDRGLVLVVVKDGDLDKTCVCNATHCADTWLDACATHLPSRP